MKIRIVVTYRVDLYDPKTGYWGRASNETETEVLKNMKINTTEEIKYESNLEDYLRSFPNE